MVARKQEDPIKAVVETFDPGQMRAVEWVWRNRIPRAMLSLLQGESGNGKTLVICDLIARVTTGRSMPLEEERIDCKPERVLILAREDPKDSVLTPRLVAAGADFDYLRSVAYGIRDGKRDLLALPHDREAIEMMVEEWGPALVYIDSITSLIGPGGNAIAENEMRRRVLFPLALLADLTGTAILGTRHFSKSSSANPRNAGIGSIAFTNVARSNMLIAPSPLDPEIRILANAEGSNLVEGFPSLEYRITTAPVVIESKTVQIPRIEWVGESPLRGSDLLVPDLSAAKAQRVAKARALVRSLLTGGSRTQDDVFEAADTVGIDRASVLLAFDDLGVQSEERDETRTLALPLPRSEKEVLNEATANVTRRLFDRRGSWRSEPAEFHEAMDQEATEEERATKGWPGNPKWRTIRMREAGAELYRQGLAFEVGKDWTGRRWVALAPRRYQEAGSAVVDHAPDQGKRDPTALPDRSPGSAVGSAVVDHASDQGKRDPTALRRYREPDPAVVEPAPEVEHQAPAAVELVGWQRARQMAEQLRQAPQGTRNERIYRCDRCGHETAQVFMDMTNLPHAGCPKGPPDGRFQPARNQGDPQ